MVCYHPIEVVFPAVTDRDGKRRLIFSKSFAKDDKMFFDDTPIVRDLYDYANIKGFKIKVPCGRCIGCRLDYSRMWAIRSIHEAHSHMDNNTFVTLTFNDDHLPLDCSLSKPFIQSWIKRFRKKFGDGIRYMLCGEYGDKNSRPHYHILFYNFKFPDQYVWTTRHGQIYYRSKMLEDLWTDPYSSVSRGFSVIGDVTFESSAYVARYVTKKMFGAKAPSWYAGREPEFMLCSRMPGLGSEYLHKYYKDIFNKGYIVLPNGYKAPIPRYYVNELQNIDLDFYNRYKVDKLRYMYDNLFVHDLDSTHERLQVREELQNLKLDKLVRVYEFNGDSQNL